LLATLNGVAYALFSRILAGRHRAAGIEKRHHTPWTQASGVGRTERSDGKPNPLATFRRASLRSVRPTRLFRISRFGFLLEK
jgi:hypothetical protein